MLHSQDVPLQTRLSLTFHYLVLHLSKACSLLTTWCHYLTCLMGFYGYRLCQSPLLSPVHDFFQHWILLCWYLLSPDPFKSMKPLATINVDSLIQGGLINLICITLFISYSLSILYISIRLDTVNPEGGCETSFMIDPVLPVSHIFHISDSIHSSIYTHL